MAQPKTAQLKVGLLGCGAIGSYLLEELAEDRRIKFEIIFDRDRKSAERNAGKLKGIVTDSFEKCLGKKVDLWIEAASQEACRLYVPKLLRKSDVLILSVGALADAGLLAKIVRTAGKCKRKVYVPSGAIAGLDAISAVKGMISEVTLETRKSPQSLGIEGSEEKVIYDGNAREACKLFPQNINVAAALSLAGIGLDRTRVRIIADPKAERNTHRIIAKGDFGEFEFVVRNVPLKKNQKTSALAALSAVACVKKILDSVVIN